VFEALTFWHWGIIVVALLLLELFIGAEFFLWLAAAALLSGIVSMVAPSLDWKIQFALYAAFSLASLVAWAKYSRNRKLKPTDQPHLNKRQNKFIGGTFRLAANLKNGEGKVIVDDAQWSVRVVSGDENAKQGSKVKVVDMDGMILLVEAIS